MLQDYFGRNIDQNGRYIDINGNIITGACFYNGIITMQHSMVFEIFEFLLTQIRPARIIEIGTSHGGLTLFLRHTLNKLGLTDSLIRTFDVNKFTSHHILKNESNLEIIYDNIFSEDYNTIINSSLITDFMSHEGTNIVLCDGGSKINEFKLISPILKSGDIIMAHDYSPNLDYFKEHVMNKTWCWLEIQDSDIEKTCEENKLQPFMATEFANAVWVCRKKL